MDSLRCVLASRLLLDHQLHGTRLSGAGAPAPEVRKIAEDATLVAFDHIIDACLVHDAHCLLISGDSFHPDDHSLRGPAALVRGIQRLAERDMAVILYARSPDLWSSWPAGLRFPPNAHRLGDGFEDSVSVSLDGKLLATITVEEQPQSTLCGWQVLLPDPTGNSRTILLPGDPAPAQGIRDDETGSRGCTLVVIDAGRELRETFIPAAPVRWERFALAVAAGMSRDDLLQEMASLLEQTPREPCEKVWLVGWDVSGEGELLEILSKPGFRDDLLADLTGLDPVPGIHVHTHALRVHLPAGAALPIAGQDELAAEYVARLAERFARSDAALHECLAASDLHRGPWNVRLETVLAELDAGEVALDAQRMAMHWFASPEELSS
ncbi:MAG: hypothetical protein ACM3U2_19205 [Deltaproteobacteria bacterium]